MNNPLVSIIVPVYNAQNSVARCLESLCAQTWKNIEIILVNDGSRDDSYAICESYRQKDPRIVLVNKENSGVSDTRNCGLSLAQGDYVQFVDSDDYIDPDFTERLVAAAEEHHADLVISPYWMVIPANSTRMAAAVENLQENFGIEPEKKPDEIHQYGFLPAGIYDRDTFARRLMDMPASFFYSVLWNKLYRRDLLVQNDLQFTNEVRWAEDMVFNLDYILCASVFVSISTPGYHYVQNAQSLLHTQINPATLVQNKLQMFQYYKEMYTKLGMYDEIQPQLYRYLVAFSESGAPSGTLTSFLSELSMQRALNPDDKKDKKDKKEKEKKAKKPAPASS